ncbi:methionyl-tRNA formyltransferase [Canibacter sp. lx-72]|uniref:methionyl-tRNA formyltransferase n=1 Tax=Canibacter zhuwentaonis TaxID=2837491 RepID=UPI001BDBCD5D|nr:methionyl-tRNA formyltransferase [Canibacter zhuwentaonis]MBT1018269.1 methionyl-tRNA formyltransferase [Canibacter zhuwentaonis]
MRIIFAGTPAIATPTLQALVAAGHDVCAVLTRADAPQGRIRKMTASPVAECAAEHGIRVIKASRLDAEVTAKVRQLRADLGVIVAYGSILGDELLKTPRLGWVNLHFSKLPAWRGAAPVQRALMAGERELGVSVFRLVSELDAGDIVTKDGYTAAKFDTADQVLTAMGAVGAGTVLDAVAVLERNPQAGTPQRERTSYAHKLVRADGRLDVRGSVTDFINTWAGVTPEPGAYIDFGGEPLKIHEIAPLAGASVSMAHSAAPGSAPGDSAALAFEPPPQTTLSPGIFQILQGRAVLQLSDGALEIVTVQPAGKQRMAATAWLNGRGKKVDFNG